MWTAALCKGWITHSRLSPIKHFLKLPYWGIVLPLAHGKEPELPAVARWLGVTIGAKDHGARDGSNLYDFAMSEWQRQNIEIPDDAEVFLSCFPRQWGYGFSPLSVYWAFRADTLHAVLFEVRNTVGGIYHYGFFSHRTLGTEKVFYVSPFIPNARNYTFNVTCDKNRFSVDINVMGEGEPATKIMNAHQTASLMPLTSSSVIKHTLRFPFQSVFVMGRILWHAALLKLKGAPYHPPSKATYVKKTYASERS